MCQLHKDLWCDVGCVGRIWAVTLSNQEPTHPPTKPPKCHVKDWNLLLCSAFCLNPNMTLLWLFVLFCVLCIAMWQNRKCQATGEGCCSGRAIGVYTKQAGRKNWGIEIGETALEKSKKTSKKKWKEILKQHSNWGIEQLGGKTFVDTDWTQSECTLGLQNANAATLYRQLSCKKAQAYLIKVAYSEQQNSNLK